MIFYEISFFIFHFLWWNILCCSIRVLILLVCTRRRWLLVYISSSDVWCCVCPQARTLTSYEWSALDVSQTNMVMWQRSFPRSVSVHRHSGIIYTRDFCMISQFRYFHFLIFQWFRLLCCLYNSHRSASSWIIKTDLFRVISTHMSYVDQTAVQQSYW